MISGTVGIRPWGERPDLGSAPLQRVAAGKNKSTDCRSDWKDQAGGWINWRWVVSLGSSAAARQKSMERPADAGSNQDCRCATTGTSVPLATIDAAAIGF
jgi:hypothetical protein